MIEKMKKYEFLVYHRDYQEFLLKLRDLGVVHLSRKEEGAFLENKTVSEAVALEKRFDQAIASLHQINEAAKVEHPLPTGIEGEKTGRGDREETGTWLLEQVENLFQEKDSLLLDGQTARKELAQIAPLEDFDPASWDRFAQRGWHLYLYAVAPSKFDLRWETDYEAIRFHEQDSQCYFAVFSKRETPPLLEAEQIAWPVKSAADLQREWETIESRRNEVERLLKTLAVDSIETLRHQRALLADELNLAKAALSGDKAAGERVVVLEGYVPVKDAGQVDAALSQEEIYFTSSKPGREDNVPLQYKNNKFARAFELITDLYDRPNYNAFDLTPFYAPFYIVFFGLCLGDCGYGLLAFIASFFIKKRAETPFMKSVGQLALYLGIGTMIFGFISGTFFGIALPEMNCPWLQPLKKLMLNSDQLFYLALALGALQITFAMGIKGITTWMRYGFLYALDAFGWMLMLWGNGLVFLFSHAGMMEMVGKQPLISPEWQKTLHWVISSLAGAMMLLFNSPEKGLRGVPLSIGSGLYGIFNKVTGLLGDLLSYIRLFALGISGSVLGGVFNFLAVSFAPDVIIARELVMLVILLFGHGINILLSGLGAFVHPLRLTFVEFYNNAGFEGGGKPYTPFKKEAI